MLMINCSTFTCNVHYVRLLWHHRCFCSLVDAGWMSSLNLILYQPASHSAVYNAVERELFWLRGGDARNTRRWSCSVAKCKRALWDGEQSSKWSCVGRGRPKRSRGDQEGKNATRLVLVDQIAIRWLTRATTTMTRCAHRNYNRNFGVWPPGRQASERRATTL